MAPQEPDIYSSVQKKDDKGSLRSEINMRPRRGYVIELVRFYKHPNGTMKSLVTLRQRRFAEETLRNSYFVLCASVSAGTNLDLTVSISLSPRPDKFTIII